VASPAGAAELGDEPQSSRPWPEELDPIHGGLILYRDQRLARGHKLTQWECHHCGKFFEGERTPDECPNCHSSLTFWLKASEPSAATHVKDQLHKIPIFFGLHDTALADMARAFREVKFAKGTAIVKEGETTRSFLILTEGAVEIRREGKLIATLLPYQFFGELAALGLQQKRTADIVASGECTCLVAIQSELQRVISSHPIVSSHILREMRNRYQPEE